MREMIATFANAMMSAQAVLALARRLVDVLRAPLRDNRKFTSTAPPAVRAA